MGQTIINSVINDLEQQAVIASTVGSDIYPLRSPSGVLPVCVYLPSDGIRQSFFKGSFGLQTDTVVFNFYGRDYDIITTIRDLFDSRYNGFSGTLNDGTLVQRITVNTSFLTLEDGNEAIYRLTTELDLTT